MIVSPGTRLRRAIDEARDTRVYEGACAHGAWLDHVERRAGEPVIPYAPRRRTQCNDLRVRRGIATSNGAVPAFAENFPVPDDHCTDRNLAISAAAPRELQRVIELPFVLSRRLLSFAHARPGGLTSAAQRVFRPPTLIPTRWSPAACRKCQDNAGDAGDLVDDAGRGAREQTRKADAPSAQS